MKGTTASRAVRLLPPLILAAVLLAALFFPAGCEGKATTATTAAQPPDAPFTVIFFDVGQGDAALLSLAPARSPGEKVNVLIDAATEQAARSTLIPGLKGLGITALDAVMVTHMDSDHSGGLFPVLDAFRVKELVLSGYFHSTEEEYHFIRKLEPYGVVTRYPRAGDRLAWAPEITVEVLNPVEPYYFNTASDENNNSLVLEVTYGVTRFLFTGDIEKEAEGRLARGRAGPVDVMKVPHHGSGGSSTPAFLAAFQPSTSVISCGRNNPYGHPSPRALARLEAYGEVLRTDTQGNVYAASDGRAVRMSTER